MTFISSDLGEHLRDQLKVLFPQGENSNLSKIEKDKISQNLDSLEKIADNYYGKKYPTTCTTTASGLSPVLCKVVNTVDFQESLKEYHKSYFTKFKEAVKSYLSNR